jgi:hypothetical protein
MSDFTIKEYPVRPVLRKAYCPDCDQELERKREVLLTCPEQYQYVCPKCGYCYNDTQCYPYIKFLEEESCQEQTCQEQNS